MSATGFRPTGFFVLRTALLPFHVLLEWGKGLTAAAASDSETLASAIACDKEVLRVRLKTIVSRPDVTEGLFLASTSTYNEIQRWLEAEGSTDDKLERTLAKYVQRMAGRPTPFGLFAGCSIGTVDGATDLVIDAAADYRRYSRLDNDYLSALTHHLASNTEVQDCVRYRPNSSLYRIGARWRLVQTSFTGVVRRDHLVEMRASELLAGLIARAGAGATLQELADHVLAIDPDGDITTAEATTYVRALVQQQVLVSDLAPLVTGSEPLVDLMEQLRALRVPAAARVFAALEEVRDRLLEIDRAPIGIPVESYRRIEHAVADLGVEPDPSRLFQVDMIKPAPRSRCGAEVINEIARAVTVLHRLSPAGENEPLRRFREAFTARYEQREVPLVEALDEESGIGFERSTAPAAEHAPLLHGLPFPSTREPAPLRWGGREAYLLERLSGVWAKDDRVLELGDDDVARLAGPEPARDLPDAFCVMAAVGRSNSGSSEDFSVLIRHAAGPSGVNVLGRFCHADPAVDDGVRRQLAAEEAFRPDAIYAEVVHLPMGRLGNVLARPVLRPFEIVYLGRSGAPAANQIPITDLLVSVRGDRVILRSARLGREIIPRLTNMHNYTWGQGLYRFMCTLQQQAIVPMLQWAWGALETLPFLPRVVHGRLVLARARWHLTTDLLRGFERGTRPEQFAAARRWRLAQKLPRFAALVEADNELPVDFDNVMSVDALLSAVKRKGSATLVEMYPDPERLAVHGPEGSFVHEIVVPFVKAPAGDVRPAVTPRPAAAGVRRSFTPGSEWLYLKWYTGTAGADVLLSSVIGELAARQMATGAASRWFFLRYGDPAWHVRLRLQGMPKRLRSATLADVAEIMERDAIDGRVWKMEADTYEREIERYGGDAGMVLSEEVFWRDSEAVLGILQRLPGDAGVDNRWRLCLRGWDLLLSDLGFPLDRKQRIVSSLRDALAKQLGENKSLTRALGDRFRHERRSLEALFDEQQEAGHPLSASLHLLRARSHALAPAMHALREAAQAARLSTSIESLAGSYLHMHANRMLRSSHQQQECVLYDFLGRLYDSQLARARGRGARGSFTVAPQA